jgi:hypothetical protein
MTGQTITSSRKSLENFFIFQQNRLYLPSLFFPGMKHAFAFISLIFEFPILLTVLKHRRLVFFYSFQGAFELLCFIFVWMMWMDCEDKGGDKEVAHSSGSRRGEVFFSGSYRIQVISVCVCVDTHTEGRGCERFDLRVYEIKKRFEGGERKLSDELGVDRMEASSTMGLTKDFPREKEILDRISKTIWVLEQPSGNFSEMVRLTPPNLTEREI